MLFWIKEKSSIVVVMFPSILQCYMQYHNVTHIFESVSHFIWLIWMTYSRKANFNPVCFERLKKSSESKFAHAKINHVFLEKNYFQPRFSLFRANKRHFELPRKNFEVMSQLQWRHTIWRIFNDVEQQNVT